MSKEVIEFRQSARQCIFCNALTSSESIRSELFNYKTEEGQVVELSAEVPVISCSSCGESYTDDRAADIRHDAVCRFLGRLTPADLREIREFYGYSQAQWSELTGIGIASIKRWETGALIQGLALDRFIRVASNQRGFDLLKNLSELRNSSIRRHRIFRTSISAMTVKDASFFQLRTERALA